MKMQRLKKASILAFFFVWAFAGCKPEGVVHEDFKTLPEATWYADSLVRFEFSQPKAAQNDVFLRIRYGLNYKFCNLYVMTELRGPTGEVLKGGLKNIDLLDCSTGMPQGTSEGEGFGGLYEYKVPLYEAYNFKEEGTYSLEIKQHMRQDTLQNVQAVGLFIQERSPTNAQ